MRNWLEVYHFRINGEPEKTVQLQQKQPTDRAAYEQGGYCQKFPLAMRAAAFDRQKQQSPLSWALSELPNPAALGLTQQTAQDFTDRVHRLSTVQMVILRQALFGLVTVIPHQWFSLFVINA